ncbi:MAG TPA: tetratricopeptide repeat protein [Pyrinomonadaceae bacterium]|nr:tetratricopeptide repeat protein [Pyrinomonadaceae bacterium]
MPQELIHLTTRKSTIRILMVLFLTMAAIWSYFVVSWYLANTFAENLPPSERDLDIARMAVSMAPDDPLVHWRLGTVSQSKLPINQINQAIAEYEKAVALSPNDYRFWTALGVAYEQAGEHDKGEVALRRAVSLAPSYGHPHWFLGNLLLRRSRYDEAFAELRQASDANEEFRPQLFILLWEIFGSDFDSLSKAVGDKATTRADFALHLLKQKRFDEGLRLWATLSSSDKVANKATADAIVTSLLANQRYYDALNVWNDVAPNAESRAAIDRITDGGFEQVANYGSDMVFAWQVKNAPQVQIGVDPARGHTGKRSLRLVFQVRQKLSGLGASQLIAVSPDTEYELEFYRKSQQLESGATPYIRVMNASNSVVLATSDGAANGDSDWQRVGLTFKTPPKSQAVIISIERDKCLDTDICPIFGTVWYDDFSFKRR